MGKLQTGRQIVWWVGRREGESAAARDGFPVCYKNTRLKGVVWDNEVCCVVWCVPAGHSHLTTTTLQPLLHVLADQLLQCTTISRQSVDVPGVFMHASKQSSLDITIFRHAHARDNELSSF